MRLPKRSSDNLEDIFLESERIKLLADNGMNAVSYSVASEISEIDEWIRSGETADKESKESE